MPTPEKHAILSASGAERWMHCPGSVSLTADLPDTTSQYAEEGRLAHAIAELKLRKHFDIGGPMSSRTYTSRFNKLKKDPLFQPEMDRYTDDYLDYITDLANSLPSKPFVAVEQQVDFSRFVPEGFGTADCVMLQGDNLYVIDLKYGRGVMVSAEDNAQLKLYALGALLAYRTIWDIETVHLTIVQPRGDGIKEAVVSAEELCDWAAFTVRPAAQKAYDGVEEYHSGPWCRWCKAQAFCREHATDVTSAVEDFGGKLPPKLTPEEFGALLHKLDPLIKYAETAKAYAQDTLLHGDTIPGWKLVEGRSKRIWDDQDAAFETLKAAGIDNTLLWHREPYSLAQIELLLGKKTFAAAAGKHVIKQPGKPTLAPQEDPRTEYSLRPSAEEDFKQ